MTPSSLCKPFLQTSGCCFTFGKRSTESASSALELSNHYEGMTMGHGFFFVAVFFFCFLPCTCEHPFPAIPVRPGEVSLVHSTFTDRHGANTDGSIFDSKAEALAALGFHENQAGLASFTVSTMHSYPNILFQHMHRSSAPPPHAAFPSSFRTAPSLK